MAVWKPKGLTAGCLWEAARFECVMRLGIPSLSAKKSGRDLLRGNKKGLTGRSAAIEVATTLLIMMKGCSISGGT